VAALDRIPIRRYLRRCALRNASSDPEEALRDDKQIYSPVLLLVVTNVQTAAQLYPGPTTSLETEAQAYLHNCVCLNTLYISQRSWNFLPSPTGKLLKKETSQLLMPGPR
jgi:hypothetical protein